MRYNSRQNNSKSRESKSREINSRESKSEKVRVEKVRVEKETVEKVRVEKVRVEKVRVEKVTVEKVSVELILFVTTGSPRPELTIYSISGGGTTYDIEERKSMFVECASKYAIERVDVTFTLYNDTEIVLCNMLGMCCYVRKCITCKICV